MQYLVPMRPTVVSPNCFVPMAGAIATVSPTAIASLRCEVAASYLLMSFLLATIRVATDVVNKRFADVSCWSVVLLLVAASTKLSKNPARASISNREHDQVGHLTKQFVCGAHALAVNAPGVHGEVGLFPFGPGFDRSILSFPFVSFLLVVA
jgi:hypothetical protein